MGDIVLQRWIQDFREGWCQHQIGSANLLFDVMFVKNCMKINEIEIELYPPLST